MPPKKNEIKLINYYDKLPKDETLKDHLYPNYNRLKIDLPARIMIVGKSGGGKTSTFLNLFELINCWTRIYIFTKKPDERLYKHLIESLQSVSEKIGRNIITVSDDLKNLPNVKDFDEKENNIIIFDDLITSTKKELAKIEEMFIRGRKSNITCVFITQSYFRTPKLIRQNSDYVIFKKITSISDLKRCIREYALSDGKAETNKIIDVYNEAMKKFENFFMIDLQTNDPSLRYRINFSSAGI
jgi:uncharacterized protein (DUF302 family)